MTEGWLRKATRSQATGERNAKFDAIWTINSVVFHAAGPQRKRLIAYARAAARRRAMDVETRGTGGRIGRDSAQMSTNNEALDGRFSGPPKTATVRD